ncbi:MAG: ribosome-associated translation inhibitor RaiA [Pseudomonadota bacterium]
MRITVTGKQIDIGDALRSHVETEVGVLAEKYSGRPVETIVTFSRDGHEHVCDAAVHLSTGLHVQAHGRASEIYASANAAFARMEKQLRRYKRRLKDHHRSRTEPIPADLASSYVLEGSAGDGEADEPASLQPVIVAETKTSIKTLSVGEAVMQMELAGSPVLVFRNSGHGGVNVVYTRDDGNIGWIDPPADQSAGHP